MRLSRKISSLSIIAFIVFQSTMYASYQTIEATLIDSNGVSETSVKNSYIGQLSQSLGPIPGQSVIFEDQPVNTPDENVFRMKGSNQEFILLDDSGNGDSKYFIITKQDYGMRAFDGDNQQKFDPAKHNNIGYFLNNEFISQAYTGRKLPDDIVKFINFNHIWVTGAGHPDSVAPDDYLTEAGVALLSFEEWQEHYAKIGYDDGITSVGWWQRSSRGVGIDETNAVLSVRTDISPDFNGCAFQYGANAEQAIRPVFYLGEDFFKDVKIDVNTIGSNVKSSILKNYNLYNIKTGNAGYSDEELDILGYGNAPSAKDLNIIGMAAVLDILTGEYTYSGNNAEQGSEYRWLVSDTKDGVFTEIENAKDKTLVLSQEYKGKYIKFSVIPRDNQNIAGMPVRSLSTVKIRDIQPITVNSIKAMNAYGNLSPTLEDTQTFIVSCSFINNDLQNRNVSLFAVFYNDTNEMLDISVSERNLAPGNSSINMSFKNESKDATILRIFAIDNTTMPKPLLLRVIK